MEEADESIIKKDIQIWFKIRGVAVVQRVGRYVVMRLK